MLRGHEIRTGNLPVRNCSATCQRESIAPYFKSLKMFRVLFFLTPTTTSVHWDIRAKTDRSSPRPRSERTQDWVPAQAGGAVWLRTTSNVSSSWDYRDFVFYQSLSCQQAIKQAFKQLNKHLFTCQWPALTQAILNYNLSSNTAQHPNPRSPVLISERKIFIYYCRFF